MKTNKIYLFTAILMAVATSGSCQKKRPATGEVNNRPPTIVDPMIKTDVAMWLTQPDKSALFHKQNTSLIFHTGTNLYPTIMVDTNKAYQTIDGFGYTLTGGSATLINNLPAAQKDALLKELFGTDSAHIGVSYLRISLGASDLSATTFTYDDLPAGQTTDNDLKYFSLEQEKTDLIPILKKVIAINPSIKILSCPWTSPIWMKTNNSFRGGSLSLSYYDAYARYFVKYIQAMKAEGITIDAITPQNEPLNPNNTPSLVMQATEQANFIKNNLGPQFKAAGISTKIITYDHNLDRTDYPLTILADTGAKQ